VEGRDKDRPRGLLGSLKPGKRKTYRYMIDVVSDRDSIEALRSVNVKVKK
jgi:hypothetical protein